MIFPRSLIQLVSRLERLPGIGPKSAQRLALYLLRRPQEEIEQLANALLEARGQVRLCERCFFLSEEPLCEICRDPRRDPQLLCVVADPRDVLALERIEYKGLYHVLHGLIAPADGIGPDQIKIGALLERLQKEHPREVILALSSTVEGNTTTLYIHRLLKDAPVRVTLLARGMPVGGELDYADSATLLSALEWRHEI